VKRHLVIGGFHVLVAGMATLAVLVTADLTGWQGPRWLAIGAVAFMLAPVMPALGERLYRRWFA
jgi:hypothetical protein